MTFQISILNNDPELNASLVELLKEMQAHYDAPCPPHDEVVEGLKNRTENSEFIIAHNDAFVLGFAAFTALYPGPYLQPGIFLKELYVRGDSRGQKIGERLMQELARIAIDRGLKRIDWTADAEDYRLLKFYDALGGARKPEKLFYRLDGATLSAIAENGPGDNSPD
jgi:ribosomal protein S18 acetylase RimI-like enzyme